jgi:hypothetical protein
LWLSAIAVLLAFTGLGCIISGYRTSRRDIDLAERLRPFRGTSVGDEAEEWLRSH